jgi:hypothetical protein
MKTMCGIIRLSLSLQEGRKWDEQAQEAAADTVPAAVIVQDEPEEDTV